MAPTGSRNNFVKEGSTGLVSQKGKLRLKDEIASN